MKTLETLEIHTWEGPFAYDAQDCAVQALEQGKVLYFPGLDFDMSKTERSFLSPEKADPKKKNISYDIRSDNLAGAVCVGTESEQLRSMLRRYALSSRRLVEQLIPHYVPSLIQARTSLRPVEIQQRKISPRKDDTRLHVDAFPSAPSKGQRILRVFTNVNPAGKPRVWRVGEPFEEVVRKIAPRVSDPIPGVAALLRLLRITKDYRTAYDHYMLHIHDTMKEDNGYQREVPQEEVCFPPGSSWAVFTDQVSHAAMAGQHVLEQTFHLPVHGLKSPMTAPLRVLERYYGKALV